MEKTTFRCLNWLHSGERLRKAREQAGLTQEKLAELLPRDGKGRARSGKTIGRMERGECPISSKYADLLANAMGYRAQYFLLKDDYETEEQYERAMFAKAEMSVAAEQAFINEIAADCNYALEYIATDDRYALIRAGEIIVYMSLDERIRLINEIKHYSTFLFNDFIKKAAKRTSAEIPHYEREGNNG